MKFEDFGLNKSVLKGIESMGYTSPTTVQEKCIPLCLNGNDIIIQSKTGSGKTAGFAIPLLNKIKDDKIRAVILVPTRELAMQVHNEFGKIGKYTESRSIPIYGGAGIQGQISQLPHKNIVVATPGRFIDLYNRRKLNLNNVEFLVLDEADRMLDMGFDKDIKFILSVMPKNRQTFLFSATMPVPIQKIAHNYMNDPKKVFLSQDRVDTKSIKQFYYGTTPNKKIETLGYILENEKPELAIVFCKTKRSVDWVDKILHTSGYKSTALHGDLSQRRRDEVISKFKQKHMHILVASDVAARGLDVDGITHVINFDLPEDPDVYIHRIGRTGRAGKTGKAISILTAEDTKPFQNVQRKVNNVIEAQKIDENKPKPHIKMVAKGRGSNKRGNFSNNRNNNRKSRPSKRLRSSRGPKNYSRKRR